MARPKNTVTEYEECATYRDKLQILIDIHVQKGEPPAGCATAIEQVGLMAASIGLMRQAIRAIHHLHEDPLPDDKLLDRFISLVDAELDAGHVPDWPNTIGSVLELEAHPSRHHLMRLIFTKPGWVAEDPLGYDNGVPVLAAYERKSDRGDPEGPSSRFLVWCQWCSIFHTHGAADGHRVAHCNGCSESPYRDTGYILKRVGLFGQFIRRRTSMSQSRRFAIFKRDEYRCRICGANADDGVTLEVDHKVAVSAGGSDDDENLWTTCYDCNRGKGDRPL